MDQGTADARWWRRTRMTRRNFLVALGAVALSAMAAVLYALVLRAPAGPPEAEGRAWLADFADRLTSPRTWGARGPDALALFPGLGPWSPTTCVLEWSKRDPAAPIVTYQRLELGRLGGDACGQAQFGMLSTTLRPSEGITAGALVERFTTQFGPPEVHRDTGLRGAITYAWQVQDGIFAHLEERIEPGGPGDLSLLFVRSYASPTELATPAEAERWMVRTVALVTGPELPNARGHAIVQMLDADMQPSVRDAAGCPVTFDANLLVKGPIATGQSLLLDQAEGQPCEDGRFSSLSMRIWQREPVTAAALADRIGARLGAPAVTRDFGRNTVKYRWTTPYDTSVELSENLSAAGQHYLGLRAWRH